MINVCLISDDTSLEELFDSEKFNVTINQKTIDENPEFLPDVVILDEDIENSKLLLLEIISKNSNKDFDIFVLQNNQDFEKAIQNGVKIIQKPVNKNILLSEIEYSYQNKKSLKELHKENMELKKNLYQIDALYSASSKFAGTLEKEKLYSVMFEIFERVLSFDIACALFRDNFEEEKIKFYINSLKKTTDELNSTLIKRLALAAKGENINDFKSSRFKIETIQNVKHSYKNEYYNPELIDFDTLLAPIVIKDKFVGIIEIFRKTPFTKEDTTCFQSIVHQVLAPLRSAILYEEVTNTNIKLKKLERIKSEFVSIVSHELRTPLTPINNALSIILSEQGGAIGDVNKNFANIAKRNVSRLSGIIEDLLDLSRMQTGKFEFKFKKTNIYPSLELAYNTFKNQAAAKNITLELKTDDNLLDSYIDSHRIDQILSNLITNAIKFTPDGGNITISSCLVKNIDENKLVLPARENYTGEFIQISVKDTGLGIEKEDIPKIFDKFSQIENTLSRNSGGIGLGLTITKHFIDAHLGGIFVDSVKNEGSSFNVLIPVYSENTAFEIELNSKIKNGLDVGYFKIKENGGFDFYQHLKDSNIIKLTKNSKEFRSDIDGAKVTKVFTADIDRSAFEFMLSKIEEEINSKDKTCDIVLSKAFYKKESN